MTRGNGKKKIASVIIFDLCEVLMIACREVAVIRFYGVLWLMFLFNAVIYWIIRDYGAEAQAGFGLGMRVMQSIFLPAMAVSNMGLSRCGARG